MNNTHPALSISVIIPHRNQRSGLLRCLAALDAGDRRPDEIIVVDNGSAQPPDDICAEFTGVTLLYQPIAGPGLARNLGVARSGGEIIAFIDADCLPARDWLAAAEIAMQNPLTDIVGGDVRIAYDNPDQLTVLEAYESIFAYRMDRYIARQGFTGTGNLVTRRRVFDAVGPFAGLNLAEDRDWGQRASRLGFAVKYHPDLKVLHPPRPNFAQLQSKWDRQIAHDRQGCKTGMDHLRWIAKALALALSPLCEIPRLATCKRVTKLGDRIRAFAGLTVIRLYRSGRMIQLAAGMDHGQFVQRWNQFDAS